MNASDTTPLGHRMREIANHGHCRAAELTDLADKLDAAVEAVPFDAKAVLGAWARAVKVYDECRDGVLPKSL